MQTFSPAFIQLNDFTAVNQLAAGAKTSQTGGQISYTFGPFGGALQEVRRMRYWSP